MRWKLTFGRDVERNPPVEAVTMSDRTPDDRQSYTMAALPQLDEMGQRGEMLRVRVAQLVERLEDIKSIPADFAAILEPLSAISAELPRARVRTAELEGLLSRERESVGDLRRQVGELMAHANATATELGSRRADLSRLESLLREAETEREEVRGRLQERSQAASDLDQQLGAETERTRFLAGETKTLRSEVQALDQSATRLGRDLAETSERLAISDEENRRLQLLAEEHAARIADLTARSDALAEENATSLERLHAVEGRLTEEIAAREKVEVQSQAELGAARAEFSNLAMRMEASTNRASALDRLLGQVRVQLRDREETVRVADRAAKDADAERLSHERRLETLQAELARSGERWVEAQQSRMDLDGRCDMLTRALAAKDATLEQALGRIASLAEQADQLSRRGEAERADLEAKIRRLTEDLHNERSERALARGALDIARESRAALQKQYETLRRSARVQDAPNAADETAQGPAAGAEMSNVRSFPPPDRA